MLIHHLPDGNQTETITIDETRGILAEALLLESAVEAAVVVEVGTSVGGREIGIVIVTILIKRVTDPMRVRKIRTAVGGLDGIRARAHNIRGEGIPMVVETAGRVVSMINGEEDRDHHLALVPDLDQGLVPCPDRRDRDRDQYLGPDPAKEIKAGIEIAIAAEEGRGL